MPVLSVMALAISRIAAWPSGHRVQVAHGSTLLCSGVRSAIPVADALHGLTAGVEATRQGGDGFARQKAGLDPGPSPGVEEGRPAKPLALGAGAVEAGLGPLYEQVPLELRDDVQDARRHPSRGAGQVGLAQIEASHPDRHLSQPVDRRHHVPRVAPEPVHLRHHQHVAGLEPVDEPREARPLHRRDAAGDGLGHDAVVLDLDPSRRDLLLLVLGRLSGGGDAKVGEGACQGVLKPVILRWSCPEYQNPDFWTG